MRDRLYIEDTRLRIRHGHPWVYDNQGCVACASGYVVNPDNNACVALASNANCLYYTYLGCRACAAGYVNNANLYFANFNSP